MVPSNMSTGWPAVLALFCAVVLASSACSRPATRTQTSPWWASVQKPGAIQAAPFRGAAGSSSDRCVLVGHHRDVRSGGFLAGPFGIDEQGFAAAYRQAGRRTEVKIYWMPLHVAHMPELTVQEIHLPDRTVAPLTRQPYVAAAGGHLFYPSAIPIPEPGTWELVAKAGPNTGCFIASFTAPAN
jgi:hypothetical protein